VSENKFFMKQEITLSDLAKKISFSNWISKFQT